MTIERQTEREFGVYNVAEDKFYNLDYIGELTNEEEFEELPKKTFTYEECQRFSIHKKEKENLTIFNMFQPKYLLAFELDIKRKQYNEKVKSEYVKIQSVINNPIQSQKVVDNTAVKKQSFNQILFDWDKLLNSHSVQVEGRFGEVANQKPKLKDFGLSLNNFSGDEKKKLLDLNILE